MTSDVWAINVSNLMAIDPIKSAPKTPSELEERLLECVKHGGKKSSQLAEMLGVLPRRISTVTRKLVADGRLRNLKENTGLPAVWVIPR